MMLVKLETGKGPTGMFPNKKLKSPPCRFYAARLLGLVEKGNVSLCLVLECSAFEACHTAHERIRCLLFRRPARRIKKNPEKKPL